MSTRKTTSNSVRSKGTAGKPSKTIAPLGKRPGPRSIAIVSDLRKDFGVSRKIFARLSNFSERAIANWESGTAISPNIKRQMQELKRLRQALAGVMEADYVGEWLQEPNEAFGGLKPLEVIERGQTDRIWRMIYILESGNPS